MKNSRWYLGRQYLGRRCRLCATNRGKTERILSPPNLPHGTQSDLRFPSTISSSCVLCTVYIYIGKQKTEHHFQVVYTVVISADSV